MSKLHFVAILATVSLLGYYILINSDTYVEPKSILNKISITNVVQPSKTSSLSTRKIPRIDLAIRMPLRKDMLERIFCDLLRSTVLFWSPLYGDVLFILDNEDESQHFEEKMNALGLPNKFRCVYEKDFIRRAHIEAVGKKQDRPYGYLRMYYSSFIMDWYVGEDDIVGWSDSDTIFTIPVTNESIFRDGKIIVKGINQYHYPHVARWSRITKFALGLPAVSDFMSYFPTHVYAKTIRNCRQFIMRRFNATTFEEAYIKMIENNAFISAVNIIFSYAYYFEKDLYDWHIDIAPETLASYNAKYVPAKYPLLESDITPDLHVTIHTRYYTKASVKPIEQSICYSQIALGMTNIPHCDKFRNQINLQLFEFQQQQTHVNTWCAPGPKREHCKKLVDERYKIWVDHYRKAGLKYDTSYIKIIEDFARTKYDINCYKFNYVPYV